MGSLSIQLRLHGEVVDNRTISVRRPLLVGDWPGSVVAYPGPPQRVTREGDSIRVGPKRLKQGESVTFNYGDVGVTLSHTAKRWTPLDVPVFDTRFLAAVIVLVASGHWLDAASHWLAIQSWSMPENVQVALEVVGMEPRGGRSSPSLAVVRGAQAKGDGAVVTHRTDGPEHLGDDHVTGVGYHRWFKRNLPLDSNAFQANERLDVDPDDIEARRIIGRAAYNAGRNSLAAWHYRQILERYPDDVHARLRLAWAERRRGRHSVEARHYREILDVQPNHPLALGGLSQAKARLGEQATAHLLLDQLHAVAPGHPFTDLSSAVVEALQGDGNEAYRSLGRVVERRELLDEELQVELRRDIATDPALSRLRTQWRLRAMLRRHLGAASPQGIR